MKTKKLIMSPLKFYSSNDEVAFFDWIGKIDCIESYNGIGRELEVIISSTNITFADYQNLNGIFKRYRLKNINQLEKLFKNSKNQDWFN